MLKNIIGAGLRVCRVLGPNMREIEKSQIERIYPAPFGEVVTYFCLYIFRISYSFSYHIELKN